MRRGRGLQARARIRGDPRKRGRDVQGHRDGGGHVMPIAMIDNYDSFTYNLVQYMAELGAEPAVFRNDEGSTEELAKVDGIVISPGPGKPDDAGISNEAVRALSGKVAILGVCLGHQCIGQVFGGEVVRNEPSHGKTSWIHHDNSGVLAGVSEPFEATRYHSLIVKRSSVPPDLVVPAWLHY